jgi:glycosyltransferase involved in cell wall biosynthesis
MNPRRKVFLTGGDGMGWALDDDLALTQRALEGMVELTNLDQCEVIHAVWWEELLSLSQRGVRGKRIICHVSGEPYRYLTLPSYRHVMAMTAFWIAQSAQAAREMTRLDIPCALIPYTTDVGVFRPLPPRTIAVEEARQRWAIPEGRYLIASFHRDTEGHDLTRPKLAKGPDTLVEIVDLVFRRGCPIHVLLAGPRRHWLRNQLSVRGIPFTFVGQAVPGDDLTTNVQPREMLNVLYNLADLYVVSSRSEGGPRSIVEASAAACKVISTPVGLAEDILEPLCVYRSAVEAVEIIEQDIVCGRLKGTNDVHYARVLENHRPERASRLFEQVYQRLCSLAPHEPALSAPRPVVTPASSGRGVIERVLRRAGRRRLRVGLWHRFFKPPYGGGNQFLLALRKGLERRGVSIRENRVGKGIDATLANSIHFDVERFRRETTGGGPPMLHRIDGPIHLIRGFDRDKDEACFRLNEKYAAATVLQSAWTYERIVEMGYRPVRPVIIHNAADPEIFHPPKSKRFAPDGKVRLVSTSWSGNPRKGGSTYKWIEEHLNWDMFDYTFVGNASESFHRIAHIPPVDSTGLARILCQQDLLVTASENDPCSNAVIEALSCSLPVLYLNDGGHPELVGQGGLPFSNREEFFPRLHLLVKHYEIFQRLIAAPKLDDVVDRYLSILRDIAGIG